MAAKEKRFQWNKGKHQPNGKQSDAPIFTILGLDAILILRRLFVRNFTFGVQSYISAQAEICRVITTTFQPQAEISIWAEICQVITPLVMTDQGFTIQESLTLLRAELAIPAFTKGKDKLDPVDVERTRGIANVRIHVESVTGLP